MPGPLLKSATLKTYHPVGAVGHPVYLAAAQLRAAIARRLGAEIADVFAIPQRNDEGDRVDWYAPNPGTVVPWSAATEAERATAQTRLLEVRERIEALGRSMETEASSERQVFGRLLAHVMQFPGEQDVHLVNGQPVLTFWGFVKDRLEVGSDPLRDLSPHLDPRKASNRAASGNGSDASSGAAGPARPWWLWLLLLLLLLLLLALLLWGLRGCEPSLTADSAAPLSDEPTRQDASSANAERSAADRSEPLGLADEQQVVTDERRLRDIDGAGRAIIRERVDRTLVGDGVSGDRISPARDLNAEVTTVESALADDLVDAAAVDADLPADRSSLEEQVIDGDSAAAGLEDVGSIPLDADAALPVTDSAEALSEDALDLGDADADGPASPDALADATDDGQAPGATDGSGRAEPPDADETAAADAPLVDEDAVAGPGPDGESGLSTADEAVALEESSSSGTDAPITDGADAVSGDPDASPDGAADRRASPADQQTSSDASEIDPSATEPGDAGAASALADAPRAAATGGSRPADAVRLPPQELLNSGWRTSTTLQDPRDGSPVHLDYRLDDGAGQVRLIRKDGSVCQSDAQASVRDGRLVVDSQRDIVCADGTNFGRPQLDCTPKAGGKASCVGRYGDGSSVPIEMQRQPQ